MPPPPGGSQAAPPAPGRDHEIIPADVPPAYDPSMPPPPGGSQAAPPAPGKDHEIHYAKVPPAYDPSMPPPPGGSQAAPPAPGKDHEIHYAKVHPAYDPSMPPPPGGGEAVPTDYYQHPLLPGYGQPPHVERSGGLANEPAGEGGNVVNEWKTGLLVAPCRQPCFCLGSCFCPCCCTFMQRKKLLQGDWSRYTCCAGICCEKTCCVIKKCEPCCLCLETCCCLGCALHGNRFMIREHYGLQNDCCDDILMCAGACCGILACCTEKKAVKSIADILFFCTIGCVLAQHEHQMKVCGYPRGHEMV
ncbi:unnamed protein product [Trypanosoma congolense IL3000]|uniref:WGS project CAEQ00000000 data, annotated contig 197 n=1 Tax=Trypanosoma congolense (strain IL3000) TaxID=1068625 RepID=F9WAG3_TRYCI|nr:unnamed protein product [Trypanosoma congolense IL3000]